jgi:uncharacterized protein (DUF736 family)
MAQIGTFSRSEDGSFVGSIRTLRLNARVRFAPVDKPSDKAPDLRGYASGIEIGVAWKQTAKKTGREFYSVKLDDPSFPAAVYASLVEMEDGTWGLIWDRPGR